MISSVLLLHELLKMRLRRLTYERGEGHGERGGRTQFTGLRRKEKVAVAVVVANVCTRVGGV